ncbi:MAG: hypothetical protein EHM34_04755 [Nitrosopumilales archaeon]|nr:MAG: hypothetical protein EHM34_04755 [Nitrosopumilales archaeon]
MRYEMFDTKKLKSNEWKIGDRVINRKNGLKQHIVNVEFWESKINQEGWINKSLIGRKAYATFSKTHQRGKDGTFKNRNLTEEDIESFFTYTKKEPDWEKMESKIYRLIQIQSESMTSYSDDAKEIIDIVKSNL